MFHLQSKKAHKMNKNKGRQQQGAQKSPSFLKTLSNQSTRGVLPPTRSRPAETITQLETDSNEERKNFKVLRIIVKSNKDKNSEEDDKSNGDSNTSNGTNNPGSTKSPKRGPSEEAEIVTIDSD